MEKNLIVDVEMHKAEDTDFYLSKGFNVIAIDADPILIRSALCRYYDHITKKQLNLGISLSRMLMTRMQFLCR